MGSEEMVAQVVEALKRARLEQGISQRELARKTGLSNGGIHHMENGQVTPTLFFLSTVARALGIRVGELIMEAEKGQDINDLMKIVEMMREESEHQ